MTIKEALKILSLPEPFTEEELKKTYRALMVMTHPDNVASHDYRYEASDVNAAYEYLLKHKSYFKKVSSADSKVKSTVRKQKKPTWNAEINNNAYLEREIYHKVEDADGETIGRAVIAAGKYTWCIDEDFSLFLLSIYNLSKRIISENDESTGRDRSADILLQGEIAYLLAQQYVDTAMILSMAEKVGEDKEGRPMFKIKGMLEQTAFGIKLSEEATIYPAGVKNHKLYVKNEDGVIGYVSFKDDRLYYGVIPLFERKAVQVKMTLKKAKNVRRRANNYYDIEMIIKLLGEDKTLMIESINMQIESLLI